MGGIESQRDAASREHKETICDVHRDIYHYLNTLESITPEQADYIRERVEVAFKMGKSMDAKLRQYKGNYDNDWWETAKRAWDWSELKGE